MSKHPKQPDIKAPRYLSAAARRWFDAIAGLYILDPQHVRILELAGRSWDRAEQARKVLASEGLTVTDRYQQVRSHPCVNIERDSQLRFARLVRELNLDESAPPEPRPPRAGRGREN